MNQHFSANLRRLRLDKQLTQEQAAMVSVGFGGGMGRLREVCGSVSGMFFVLSKVHGYADPKEKDEKMDLYARVQELALAFQAKKGSYLCRDDSDASL